MLMEFARQVNAKYLMPSSKVGQATQIVFNIQLRSVAHVIKKLWW